MGMDHQGRVRGTYERRVTSPMNMHHIRIVFRDGGLDQVSRTKSAARHFEKSAYLPASGRLSETNRLNRPFRMSEETVCQLRGYASDLAHL